MNYIYPDQRVSTSEKMKDSWYINNIKYWISTAISANDKKLVSINMDAANGIVDVDTYKYVLQPLQADKDVNKSLPGEIRDIDFITPIKEKNLGEYIDLPYNFYVKVNDPEFSIKRSVDVANTIKPIIEQVIINAINQQYQTDVPSKPIEDIQAEIKKVTEQWFDSRVENAQNTIEAVNDLNDFENKRLLAFYNWWSTEEFYIEIYVINGDVYYDIISPLDGYPILSGAEFVDEGEAFLRRGKLSLSQVYTYYDKELSSKDREYLKHLMSLNIPNGMNPVLNADVYKDICGRKAINKEGSPYNDNDVIPINNINVIDENIVYFRTQVKKKFLTTVNQLGETIEKLVDDDYILDPIVGDISIRSEWMNEIWRQVLLGDEVAGIYLKPEPIEIQIYNSRGDVKLPIIGKKGILTGIDINPIPKRILPSLALYRIINLHIERQLAKYKGAVEVIPQGLLESTGATPKAAMFYKLADNTIIYDETKFSANDIKNGYQIIGNSSISNYIRDLIDLRESVKSEAWDLANMNDARAGQAPSNSTVRNNEQNLYRAKLGSILMTTIFNNTLARLHNTTIEYSKVAYPDGLNGSIFRKDGKVTYFNIPGGSLTDSQFGVFVTNSVIEKQKLDEYKALAFNASQNGNDALASEAISQDTVSGVRLAVTKFSDLKRSFEEQQAQQEQASNEKIAQMQLELEDKKHTNRLAEIEIEQQMITDRDIEVAKIKTSNNNNKEL